jgi:hypothetical protein
MFTANSPAVTNPNTAPMTTARRHWLRSNADTSNGAIRPTCVGLEKVAMPSRMAATTSERGDSSQRVRHEPIDASAIGPATSL